MTREEAWKELVSEGITGADWTALADERIRFHKAEERADFNLRLAQGEQERRMEAIQRAEKAEARVKELEDEIDSFNDALRKARNDWEDAVDRQQEALVEARQSRHEALEEAARACDALTTHTIEHDDFYDGFYAGAGQCAKAIRSLMESK